MVSGVKRGWRGRDRGRGRGRTRISVRDRDSHSDRGSDSDRDNGSHSGVVKTGWYWLRGMVTLGFFMGERE